jgi:PAS domain S-box-containing protein
MKKLFRSIKAPLPATEWVPIFSLVIVLTICVLDFIGWMYNIPWLLNYDPHWTPMRVITALCLTFYAFTLFLIKKKTSDSIRFYFARITGTSIIVICTLTFIVIIGKLNSGSESVLANAPFLSLFLAYNTRMALITASILFILGIILILLSRGSRKSDDIAHVLLLPAAILSYFVPLSYLLDVHELFNIDQIFAALNTGIALLLICLTILFIRTESWLMKVLTGHHVGSIMARRLLPGLLILPIVIGWFRIQGEQYGIFKSEVGVILVALTYTVSFLLLVWFSARSVNLIDEQRQKSVEEQLILQSRFGTTLASIGDAVIATDLEGKISFINPVAEKLTGWTLDEAINQQVDKVFKIINEATQKEVESPIYKVLGTGVQVGLANHTVLIRKDGSKIFIDDSAAPIKDKYDKLSGVVLVFRDISERKKADQALRENEQRLKFHFENSPLAVVEWDADFIVTQWSIEAERMFGWRKEEALGKPLKDLNIIFEEDIPLVNTTMERLIGGKESMIVSSNRNYTKSGAVIECVWYNSVLLDQNGKMNSVMSLVQDITDSKMAEKALKLSEERIRNKLESILSPEGDIGELELGDIIDSEEIQEMMVHFYDLAKIPMAIIDLKGKVLVGVGWQDICTKFHRVHPETCRHCIESDLQLTAGIPEGEYKLYKCANGMWDMATPIVIGGQHKGNLFMGQFFFEDEQIDYDLFRSNAVRYSFDKKSYLTALEAVPRIESTKLESAKGFFLKLANKISKLSYSNVKLARYISESERIGKQLVRNNERLDILSETAGSLLESQNPQLLVEQLCSRVMKFLDCQAFFNFMVDEKEGKLHLNAYMGIPERTAKSIEWLDFGVAVCGCVARDGVRIIAENIPETPDVRTDLIKSFGIKAYCCHPILTQAKVLGTLSFGTKSRISFSEDDIAMMKSVTDLVSIGMSRMRDLEAVRKSEERLHQQAEMLEYAPVLVRNMNEEISLWNGGMEKLYGFTRADALGKNPHQLLQTVFPKPLSEILGELFENNSWEGELGHKRKDGAIVEVLSLWRLHCDDQGNPIAIIEVNQDITALKKRETELRQLNRILNALGKSSQAMMHTKDEVLYLREVCRILVEECGHPMVWIGYAQDDEYKSVTPVAYSGFEEGYLENLKITWADTERGRGPTGTAIRTGKPSTCRNMHTDPAFVPWREDAIKRGYNASVVFPLFVEGKTIGAISIYSGEPDAFTDEEINLLSDLADDLSLGITTIRLRESENKAVALLSESEEKYRLLFNEMLEGFAFHEIILDEKGKPCDYRFLSMNPAFEKHTGLKAENVIGKTVKEVIPTLENYWINTYGEVALTGKNIEFEDYNAQLNSYFKVSAFSPKKGYFAVIMENITERTLAAKELYNTKTYLESLINYANAPIIVWNPKFEIQLFNRAFEKLTGYSSSEVEGQKLDMLFPESSARESNAKIRQALHEHWESIEIPILTKDGEERIVLWNSANVYDSDNKTLISTIAQGNDITERKKAEQRLNDARKQLDLALDNGKIGTFERNFATNELIWDRRMERMFGYKEGTFEGTYEAFEKCLVEEDVAHTRAASRKAVEENIPFETVYRIKLPNGNINHINAKGLVIRDENGKALKMAGVCFDVTDMKKGAEKVLIKLNEELQRSNKELEQFAYVASHDLQEPLRMVSSFTQLLQKRYKDRLDEDAQQFIQYAVDGAVRMQGLINDLLNFSRIGTRGQQLAIVDFNQVMGKTISNLTISIQEKNALIFNDELPSVMGDENQLVQMMQNLIGNSLKFCKTNPRIHISAVEKNDHYLFSVKDNGIGIEKIYFEKIFLIFQRLVPKEEYGGTGIGLAICKRIVERHGGKIWVESELGEGATFYFTLNKPKNQ